MTESFRWHRQWNKWTLVTVQLRRQLFAVCRLKTSKHLQDLVGVINPSSTTSTGGNNFPAVRKLPCNMVWSFSCKTFSQINVRPCMNGNWEATSTKRCCLLLLVLVQPETSRIVCPIASYRRFATPATAVVSAKEIQWWSMEGTKRLSKWKLFLCVYNQPELSSRERNNEYCTW